MKGHSLVLAWLVSMCLIQDARAAQTSSIALSPDESTVLAVNPDHGSVSLWNFSGDGSLRIVPVGEEPRTLAVSPDGREAYVANQSSQTLSVVDVPRGRLIREIRLGGQPYGILLSPDGQRAFVSQYAGAYADGKYHTGAIAVVDLRSDQQIACIGVKPHPWAMAMREDGSALYITHYLSIGGQGLVTEVDPRQYGVVREIAMLEDDDVRGGGGGVFNALASIALHPNGQRALVAGMHANVRRGLALSGQQLSHKTTVQSAVRVLDLGAGQEVYGARIVSSFGGQAVAVPSAVRFIGSGEHYIDVYFASNDFKIIQYNERGIVAERALRGLPAGPTGVVVTRDAHIALFHSRWDNSISQFSLVDIHDPKLVKRVCTCSSAWSQQRLEGALLFHNTRDTRMTANRWMSCAVCHLDGALITDGLVWDLTYDPAKPKVGNTMDLINTPFSSPPFFHRGAPDVVKALDRFVLTFQQGSGFLRTDRARATTNAGELAEMCPEGDVPATTPEWAAMVDYMQELRARPNPHIDGNHPRPEIRDAVERGRRLFYDPAVGCGICHCGPALTLSGRPGVCSVFDVGTGKKMDTPSLLNLWCTAPYLHDGRAPTLRDVLTTCNQDDLHGTTSRLSARELDDLATFLLAPIVQEH